MSFAASPSARKRAASLREAEQETIGPMMAAVATGEPEITFWRKLETGDDIGWE